MNQREAAYKIALVQMECDLMDVPKNLDKAEVKIREAAANGAKMICLPEVFNVGYLSSRIQDMIKCAETEDGISLGRMKKLAKELGVFILAPVLYSAAGGVENTAFLIDSEGQIVGHYSKTHPVGDERTYLQRGNQYPVFDTSLGKIGIAICYDVCFPETVRMLALRGAEVILVSAAWRASYYFKEWWDLNLSCRALDNLVYVAAVNRCGPSGEEIFAGKSQICSPVGEMMDSCGISEEAILYGVIELGRVAREREFNTVLTDRHPEDYRIICEIEKNGGNANE